jgi:hypothetical protein
LLAQNAIASQNATPGKGAGKKIISQKEIRIRLPGKKTTCREGIVSIIDTFRELSRRSMGYFLGMLMR